MEEVYIKEDIINATPGDLIPQLFDHCVSFKGDEQQLKAIENLLDLGVDINHQDVHSFVTLTL